jgi:predicted phosphodiesterase
MCSFRLKPEATEVSMRRLLISLLLLGLTISAPAATITLPLKPGSVKFAVIGDTGTGDQHERDVAKQLSDSHQQFPFDFVIMMGDNMYGGDKPKDYVNKFEAPYKSLLDGGVKFYAALGNHDNPNQRFYKPFNMGGERYYSFKPSLNAGVRFFALDSNYIDKDQLDWFEKQLAASGSDWKIAYFHHPPYSSGETHGSSTIIRDQLEPIFTKYGVSVVFTGHEHFYERIKPQKGITYIIQGSSAKLRTGDITKTDLTAKGYDRGYTFMLVEIDGDQLTFQTISQTGESIDSGTIHRVDVKTPEGNRPITTAAAPPPGPAPKGTTGVQNKSGR